MFVADYEDAVAREAVHRGMDGVVCGHIHKAELHPMGQILYCNNRRVTRATPHGARSWTRCERPARQRGTAVESIRDILALCPERDVGGT